MEIFYLWNVFLVKIQCALALAILVNFTESYSRFFDGSSVTLAASKVPFLFPGSKHASSKIVLQNVGKQNVEKQNVG
jgi:hypothetical protein